MNNVVDMKTVSSTDGTRIAYDEMGRGPALILVDGALNSYSSGSHAGLATSWRPTSGCTAMTVEDEAKVATRRHTPWRRGRSRTSMP